MAKKTESDYVDLSRYADVDTNTECPWAVEIAPGGGGAAHQFPALTLM